MRHSLFFGSLEAADKAEAEINMQLVGVIDSFQTDDCETGTIEVRFFTDRQLNIVTQRHLLRVTQCENYALNCEDV